MNGIGNDAEEIAGPLPQTLQAQLDRERRNAERADRICTQVEADNMRLALQCERLSWALRNLLDALPDDCVIDVRTQAEAILRDTP